MTTTTIDRSTEVTTTVREAAHLLRGQATQDGAGVKLTRMLDSRLAELADPFLMLDEFRSDTASDYIAGFPPHPHRGFETVTLMFAGRMRHKDNHGNEGVLVPGIPEYEFQYFSPPHGLNRAAYGFPGSP